MQRIEITVKGSSAEPLTLAFISTDSADAISEKVRTLTWVIGQLDGHTAETRRRALRQERVATPSGSHEPPIEA
jgi:hypothetical protein